MTFDVPQISYTDLKTNHADSFNKKGWWLTKREKEAILTDLKKQIDDKLRVPWKPDQASNQKMSDLIGKMLGGKNSLTAEEWSQFMVLLEQSNRWLLWDDKAFADNLTREFRGTEQWYVTEKQNVVNETKKDVKEIKNQVDESKVDKMIEKWINNWPGLSETEKETFTTYYKEAIKKPSITPAEREVLMTIIEAVRYVNFPSFVDVMEAGNVPTDRENNKEYVVLWRSMSRGERDALNSLTKIWQDAYKDSGSPVVKDALIVTSTYPDLPDPRKPNKTAKKNNETTPDEETTTDDTGKGRKNKDRPEKVRAEKEPKYKQEVLDEEKDYNKLVVKLKEKQRHGKLAEYLAKKYPDTGLAGTESVTLREGLALLAQAKVPALQQWTALMYVDSNTDGQEAQPVHKWMNSLYALLADSDFSGRVIALPNAENRRYKNGPLSFGGGTKRAGKDMERADVDWFLEGGQRVHIQRDAVATIQLIHGCTAEEAQKIFCTNICDLSDVQSVSWTPTPDALFAALKADPLAIDRFHTNLSTYGNDAWYLLVYGKTGGDEQIKKKYTKVNFNETQLRTDAAKAGMEQEKAEKASIDQLLEAVAKEQKTTPEAVRAQYETAIRDQADACRNKLVAELQKNVQQESEPEKKQALLTELRALIDNKATFYRTYQHNFGTVFLNMVKGASVVVGVGNSVSIQQLAEWFGKKQGFAGWMSKVQINVGVGYNQLLGGMKVLSGQQNMKPAINIGLSFADALPFGKGDHVSLVYGVGAGGSLYVGGTQRGVGGYVGVEVAVNTLKNKPQNISGRGKNIVTVTPGGFASIGKNGVAFGPDVKVGVEKERALNQLKRHVYDQMKAFLTTPNLKQSLDEYMASVTKEGNDKDRETFQQMYDSMMPIVSMIDSETDPNAKAKLAEVWAQRCTEMWEMVHDERMYKGVRFESIGLSKILLAGAAPSPFTLLLAASSSLGWYGRPVYREDPASISRATAEIAEGKWAVDYVLDEKGIEWLNALLEAKDGQKITYQTQKIDQKTPVGGTVPASINTITIPASLFSDTTPVLYIHPTVKKYLDRTKLTNGEEGLQIPKELVQASVYEGVRGKRQVVLSINTQAGLENSQRATSFAELDTDATKNPLEEWYALNMKTTYADVQATLQNNFDSASNPNMQEVMRLMQAWGWKFVKNTTDNSYFLAEETTNGVKRPYLLLEAPANAIFSKTVTIREINGKKYVQMYLDTAYTIEEKQVWGSNTMTINGAKSVNNQFWLAYETEKNYEVEGSFGVSLDKLPEEIYEIMWNHELLMQAKYLNWWNGKVSDKFLRLRKAINEHNLDEAKSAVCALFENRCALHGQKLPDLLNRANVRALDTALCMISYTRDKSYEKLSEASVRLKALFDEVKTFKSLDEKNALFAMVNDVITNKRWYSDAEYKMYQKFAAGGYTTKTSFARGTPEYRLKWMMTPLREIELKRRRSTEEAMLKEMPNLDVKKYMETVWNPLLGKIGANRLVMSTFPDPKDFAKLTDPSVSEEEKKQLKEQFADVKVVPNGIGMVFWYHKESGDPQYSVDEKFTNHPVIGEGLTRDMSDDQGPMRKKYFIDQMRTKAPDIFKTYYDQVLQWQWGYTIPPENFTEDDFVACLEGRCEREIIDSTWKKITVIIEPTWQEGFFIQCFNPTMMLDIQIKYTKTEKKPTSVEVTLPECKEPQNSVQIAASVVKEERTKYNVMGAGTYAEFEPAVQAVLDGITATWYNKLEYEEYREFTGKGETFTVVNELFTSWADLSALQREKINAILTAMHGEKWFNTPMWKMLWSQRMADLRAWTQLWKSPDAFIRMWGSWLTPKHIASLTESIRKNPTYLIGANLPVDRYFGVDHSEVGWWYIPQPIEPNAFDGLVVKEPVVEERLIDVQVKEDVRWVEQPKEDWDNVVGWRKVEATLEPLTLSGEIIRLTENTESLIQAKYDSLWNETKNFSDFETAVNNRNWNDATSAVARLFPTEYVENQTEFSTPNNMQALYDAMEKVSFIPLEDAPY